MIIRSPYNYDVKKASDDSRLECLDPHLTVQDQAQDVNDMVRQFGITGNMPLDVRMPLSGDFTQVGTYQDCLQQVKMAQNEFMKLPAVIRERFGHDPQEFMEFIEDERNAAEGEKLGIWKLKKTSAETSALREVKAEVKPVAT